MKRFMTFMTCLILVFCSGCSGFGSLPKQENVYTQACELVKEGKYEQAYPLFVSLGDYKDSALHLSRFAYLPVKTVEEDDGMMEGIYLFTTTYTYNEYGECTSKVGAYENEVGPGYSEQYTYDDSGRLVKRETLSEAGFSTITYEYDGNGNMIKQTGATEGANVGGITTYTYDGQGNRVSAQFDSYFGADTSQYASQQPYHSEKTDYYYDSENRCNKVKQQYSDEYLFTYTVDYNESSLPVKIVSDDSQGTVHDVIFTYDDSGRCSSITTSYEHTAYSYADGDLPVSAVRTRSGGAPCDITYTYKLFYLRSEKEEIPFHIKQHLDFLEW